jgi:hypothetical protein
MVETEVLLNGGSSCILMRWTGESHTEIRELFAVARAKKGDEAAPERQVAEGEKAVKVVVDDDEDVGSIYVNFAEVAHAQHELTAYFVQIPTKLSLEAREAALASGQLRLRPIVNLILPPTLARGLVRALTLQIDAYERRYGPIQRQEDDKEGDNG